MFGRLRCSSPARLALCLASLLAVAGAFGLHPEQPLRAAPAADSPEISGTAVPAAAHACPACLAHVAGAVRPFAGFVPVPAASQPPSRAEAPPFLDRLAGRELSGRSPPDRS